MLLLLILPILALAHNQEHCDRIDDTTCSKTCPFGYAKDNDGCYVCECLPEGHPDEMFEGDIAVDADLREYINSLVNNEGKGAISWSGGLWKGYSSNGKYLVPYYFNGVGSYARQSLLTAFSWWEQKTCLKFVPRNGHNDYINIFSGSGCYGYSNIGRRGGWQDLRMGNCDSPSLAFHELMHAVGFFHEQARPDRNNYVNINWNCIQSGQSGNFNINNNIDSLGSAYDIRSIMHYASNTFSCCGCYAITTKSGGYISYPNQVRDSDVYQINKLYGCS